jgi:hypothetical protein
LSRLLGITYRTFTIIIVGSLVEWTFLEPALELATLDYLNIIGYFCL